MKMHVVTCQVKLIRDLLRKKRLFSVVVFRAANVQGILSPLQLAFFYRGLCIFHFPALQYKVVILSCVMRRIACLHSEGVNFGFLSDENLLNTVLTRAKSLVIAIGDAPTLCAVGKCSRKWRIFLKVSRSV